MLRDTQSAFRDALLAAEGAPPAGVIAGDPARAAARFAIHRATVLESLAIALGHTFPVTRAIVGEDNFRVLAAGFVRAAPPWRPSLAEYGGGFADHVAGHAGAMADFPFLAALARLEWTLNDAYFADEAPALAADELAAVAPDDLPALRLALHPAARIVADDAHPIHTLWATETAPAAPLGGEAALVFRAEGRVQAARLGRGETVFLQALGAGAPLEKAAEAALAAEAEFDLAAVLAAALARGAFAARPVIDSTGASHD